MPVFLQRLPRSIVHLLPLPKCNCSGHERRVRLSYA